MSSLGGLGSRSEGRPRFALRPLVLLASGGLMLLGVLFFGLELVNYSSSTEAGNLQADVRVAGLQVGGLSESEAQRVWEKVYLDQPLSVVYGETPIILNPREIGFQTNNTAMLAAIRAQTDTNQSFWDGFWAHLWNQAPAPVVIDLNAELQAGQLRTALEDIAARYDTEAGGIGFDPQTLTFQSGAAGTRLDIEAAIPLIEAALRRPNADERRVDLPTAGVLGDGAQLSDLRAAIIAFLESQGFLYDGLTTIGSIFILDLNTGGEINILGDVAHSAVSTIKVGLMINYYRYQVTAPDPQSAYLLASAIICSQNSAANFLLQLTSDSKTDMIQGLGRASETMLELGAFNSWITSPLFVGAEADYPIIQKPAREALPNPAHNAQADPLNTTTAEDMGTMLAMIYDCAVYGGGLMAAFPDQITQDECLQMIEVLSGVKFSRFSELGAAPGVRVAHKVGYGAETVGDVAIVFSPGADYVFVVYIWEEDVDNDKITELDKWNLIDELARLVYNYFNPDQPQTEARPPLNPLGGAACVLPYTAEEINLNDIDQNRYDAAGDPLPSACYDFPACRPFDNWGQNR
jgi:hypothetical protein